jgi:hypothetical protein
VRRLARIKVRSGWIPRMSVISAADVERLLSAK